MSRRAVLVITTASLALVLASFPHAARLVWNASASAPIGLYRLTQQPAAIGELVLVDPPPDLAQFAAQRHYLPLHVPLIKRLAAHAHDIVCSTGHAISIDGRYWATRQDTDSKRRPLPHWSGCRRLDGSQVFLLNTDAPGSFDSRYFGPLRIAAIDGVLVPLWTR